MEDVTQRTLYSVSVKFMEIYTYFQTKSYLKKYTMTQMKFIGGSKGNFVLLLLT